LVLVSGLGADARLFIPQQALPWPIRVVEWIEPQHGEPLAGYAERLVERVKVEKPFFLGGVSMGGMIALEMSRWMEPEAVFLIASARSGRAINPLFRACGRLIGGAPLWAGLPPAIAKPVALLLARYTVSRANHLTHEQAELCRQMAADASPRFVRWGCRATVGWPGVDLPRVAVYHIHGDRDRMMPLRRVKPDHVVRGGGHLINLTHADEVNAYVAEKIAGHKL
jgi:pimeloyl-ACP methyl ester carboxylesterase